MRSTFYFIVVAAVAALQVPPLAPASAEENAAPPPVQAAPPQPETQPQPQSPQSQAPSGRDSDDNRRFVFHRVDGNLLRLDMRTGAVAACNQTGAEWTCVPGRDDRAALDRQIAQLQRDNAILKNALLEHGVPLPGGMAPPPPSGGGWWNGDESIPRPPQTVPPSATPGTPPEPAQGIAPQDASPAGEVDRIMDAVERGWRRLVEAMTNLKRDLEK
jgi:hypothetical protein